MSDVLPSMTQADRATLLADRDARLKHSQHWSSPYAAKRVHLIGVGGCGMSGLAGIMLRCGAIVSGSDLAYRKTFERLEELGATITLGHAPVGVPSDCDMIVYSVAIKRDNPELAEARRRGIPCFKYAEMLGNVLKLRTGIAVAGTHGKSTTTAMLAFVLRHAKADPTFVIGAEVDQLGGGAGVGDGPHFVVEACEYDESFLNFKPQIAAILNVEEDHLDYYANLDAIVQSFSAFASGVASDGVVIANGADDNVMRALRGIDAAIETFGLHAEATWRAVELSQTNGRYAFEILHDGIPHMKVQMQCLPGRHQVFNALAVAAISHHAGIEPDMVADGLSKFHGADRRFSLRGNVRGITVLDDYGHHPTEIRATLHAVRETYVGRRVWVVFQPHQHSRTRFLLEDFARSFDKADHLLVPDIYFVRDSEQERNEISSSHLVDRVRANGCDALYLPTHEEILDHLMAEARPDDVVVTMGAGDVWKISDELVRRLG